ncbi:MAG: exopolyphosphatase [Bacteroidia bacterium]|nr:MAG: exopolyphosphatase [Bacteroidia bacterium]
MKKITEKNKLLSHINKAKKIVIFSHHNPDADAVGSSLALYLTLKKLKKNVHIILPNEFPAFLNWMPHSNKIIIFEKQKETSQQLIQKSDLIFLLDCNAFKRLGTDGLAELAQNSSAPKILIDHHRFPEKYFNAYFFNDKASSTCELIYQLVHHLKLEKNLDKKIAQCLYTGLITDTGSFKYDSVTPETLEIAAHLLKFKINHTYIQQQIFDTYSYNRLKLVGYALSQKLKYLKEYNTAYIALSQKELKSFNFQKGDTEGLVNYGLSIKDVVLSALITETDKMIRISLRSKGNLDVNEIARKHFNGGGHKNAAGGQLYIPLDDAIKTFENVVKSIRKK